MSTLTKAQTSPAYTATSTDFYGLDDLLTPDEREIRYRVREFMRTEVEPIINPYWERAEFPMELIPKIRTLGLAGGPIQGYGCPGLSAVGVGMLGFDMSCGDASISTFFGVHSGLAMGTIWLLGSEAQKDKWLPPMARMEKLGCFGLTEPRGGSDASHPETTARRAGESYVLNGSKRWIGNATMADIALIWAKNEETGQVNGFLVETNTPGYHATPIEGKIAKRAIINADITLDNCAVPLDAKLEKSNSFRDTAKVLLMTRIGVAWEAIGHSMAAYEYALDYARKRMPFGKPIGSYQMIQDKLVRMLACITSMQFMTLRLSQLFDLGKCTEGQASLAKAHNARTAREVVA